MRVKGKRKTEEEEGKEGRKEEEESSEGEQKEEERRGEKKRRGEEEGRSCMNIEGPSEEAGCKPAHSGTNLCKSADT